MEIRTVINRTKRFNDKKYWFSTSSFQDGQKWFNTLYIHFAKENFPGLVYPKLIPCEWLSYKQRFDYGNCSVAKLDWHGGITFYEEIIQVECGKTYVKAGCDYSHLWDDHYALSDYGESILKNDILGLATEFECLQQVPLEQVGDAYVIGKTGLQEISTNKDGVLVSRMIKED